MFGGVFPLAEPAGRLDDHIDPEILPRNGGWIFLRADMQRLVIDRNGLVLGLHSGVQNTVHRVVFQQMRQRRAVGDIVHGQHIDRRIFHGVPINQSSDSSKSIDAQSYCHIVSSS